MFSISGMRNIKRNLISNLARIMSWRSMHTTFHINPKALEELLKNNRIFLSMLALIYKKNHGTFLSISILIYKIVQFGKILEYIDHIVNDLRCSGYGGTKKLT